MKTYVKLKFMGADLFVNNIKTCFVYQNIMPKSPITIVVKPAIK